jgi:hypothetical protein
MLIAQSYVAKVIRAARVPCDSAPPASTNGEDVDEDIGRKTFFTQVGTEEFSKARFLEAHADDYALAAWAAALRGSEN